MALLGEIIQAPLYVMRHGRTVLDDEKRSDGWLDFPLSDEGRVGLIKAQQYLKNADISIIYTPHLRRAYETGHIIASGTLSNPKVEIDDHCITWNLGMLMGTKKKPNKVIVQYYMDHPSEKPAGGESMRDFHDRFIPWVNKKINEVRKLGRSILVVTSGSNLRMIGQAFVHNKDTFDLDESGLISLTPKAKGGVEGKVLFGHKRSDKENLS